MPPNRSLSIALYGSRLSKVSNSRPRARAALDALGTEVSGSGSAATVSVRVLAADRMMFTSWRRVVPTLVCAPRNELDSTDCGARRTKPAKVRSRFSPAVVSGSCHRCALSQ